MYTLVYKMEGNTQKIKKFNTSKQMDEFINYYQSCITIIDQW